MFFNIIPASIHSDDFVHNVSFDALEWFKSACPEEIIALKECDWRGNYAADNVALSLEDTNPKIAALLNYCRNADVGFEVQVNEEEARQWLANGRPIVSLMIQEESNEFLNSMQAKELEVCEAILQLDIDSIQKVVTFINELKEEIRRKP